MDLAIEEDTLQLILGQIRENQQSDNVEPLLSKLRSSDVDTRKVLVEEFPVESMPAEIKRGTLDEYIYGCTIKPKALDVACTPSCVDGLKRPDTLYCDIQTYTHFKGILIKNNDGKTKTGSAYLFTDSDTLSDDVKNTLREDRITSISIFKAVDNTLDYEFIEDVEIKRDTIDRSTPARQPQPLDDGPKSGGWEIAILFFAILLFLVFLVVAAMRTKRYM